MSTTSPGKIAFAKYYNGILHRVYSYHATHFQDWGNINTPAVARFLYLVNEKDAIEDIAELWSPFR
jgi:hypothetical protein